MNAIGMALPNKAFGQTRRSSEQGRGVGSRCSTPRRWQNTGGGDAKVKLLVSAVALVAIVALTGACASTKAARHLKVVNGWIT